LRFEWITMLRTLPRSRRLISRTFFADAAVVLAVIALVASIVFWFAGQGTTGVELKLDGPGYGQLIVSSSEGRMVIGVDDHQPDYPLFRWGGRRSGSDLYDLINDDGQYVMASPWAFGFAAPHWLIGLILCVPIAWRWLVWQDRSEEIRRREHGLCRHCGYDLRASLDRCPECGEPIPSLGVAAPANATNVPS
jgi:hypothetical protein